MSPPPTKPNRGQQGKGPGEQATPLPHIRERPGRGARAPRFSGNARPGRPGPSPRPHPLLALSSQMKHHSIFQPFCRVKREATQRWPAPLQHSAARPALRSPRANVAPSPLPSPWGEPHKDGRLRRRQEVAFRVGTIRPGARPEGRNCPVERARASGTQPSGGPRSLRTRKDHVAHARRPPLLKAFHSATQVSDLCTGVVSVFITHREES